MKKFLNTKYIYLYLSIAVLVLFTGFYFVTANKMSYAFSSSEVDIYEAKITMIEKIAVVYAEENPDIFGENDYVYMTVAELIEAGALIPDNEEKVIYNPLDNTKTLNDLKVKITTSDGKVKAEVLN